MHAFMLSCFSHVWFFATLWTVRSSGSSAHGILQARIQEWVAMSSSREFPDPCPLHWQAGSLDRGTWHLQSMGWQRVRHDWGTHTFTASATWKALRVLRGRVKGRSSSLFSMPRFNIGYLPVDCGRCGGIFNSSYLDGMDFWDFVFVRDSPIKILTFCRPQSLLESPQGPSCLQGSSLLLAWGFLTFWQLTDIFKMLLFLFHCDNQLFLVGESVVS